MDRSAVAVAGPKSRRGDLRAVITTLLMVLALLAGATPTAHAATLETAAVVLNEYDGTTQWRSILQTRRSLDREVHYKNSAVAVSRCTDCRTTAISFQVGLATGGPNVVEADNLALALNEECLRCVTAAFAYQFLIANDAGPVTFSADGNQRLAEVHAAIEQLRQEGLSPSELAVRLDALAEVVRDVLQHGLHAAGAPAHVDLRVDREMAVS